MASVSLESPATFRLVAAAAAMVGSLALVALGVQIGTDGLGADGPDRTPASETASPAAAVVALPRSRAAGLDQTLISLVPLAGLTDSGAGAAGGLVGGSASGAGATAGAGGTPTAAPAPAPGPAEPSPSADPTGGAVPVPAPTPPSVPVPDPAPILAPLAPVLEPFVGDTLSPLGLTTADEAPATPPDATEPPAAGGLLTTLTGLLGL